MINVKQVKSANGITFFVREEFLTRCPNPSEFDTYDLVTIYNITKYLHNERGPAIVDSGNNITYYFNGINVTKQDHNKLEDFLDEN